MTHNLMWQLVQIWTTYTSKQEEKHLALLFPYVLAFETLSVLKSLCNVVPNLYKIGTGALFRG
jgi:hypothetical protein